MANSVSAQLRQYLSFPSLLTHPRRRTPKYPHNSYADPAHMPATSSSSQLPVSAARMRPSRTHTATHTRTGTGGAPSRPSGNPPRDRDCDRSPSILSQADDLEMLLLDSMNPSPHAHHPAPPVAVWNSSNRRVQAPSGSRTQKHRWTRCTFLNRHLRPSSSWTLKPPCSTVAVPRGRHSSDEHTRRRRGRPVGTGGGGLLTRVGVRTSAGTRCNAEERTGCHHLRGAEEGHKTVRLVTKAAAWLATRRLHFLYIARTGLGSIAAKGFDGGGTARAPSLMASAPDSMRDIEGMCLMAAGRRRRRL
ncbi:hypothetical protein GGX14DRAFT_611264 [Mycena pura]|uniref:Uncharacterized protein n=1 Tax=Mycena pura TaxID=153505 RepID=A0AAD6Y0P0_9AGAR|nr:hypothetical protein GGX14DRAFT_611264 [Mycena pura]